MDRKAVDPPGRAHYYWSLSARRAWIEKTLRLTLYLSIMVALRKEGVDRNTVCQWKYRLEFAVALRKEGVDRNTYPLRPAWRMIVALRKESVDRNL